MKNILFITMHRLDRSPSQRFRFEQYLNELREHGFQCHLSFLITPSMDVALYQPGHYFQKFNILISSIYRRIKDVLNAKRYDIIFIQREAFMLGTTFFERLFALSKSKIIFDFDDAIWLPDFSDNNKRLGFLKNPAKTETIIRLSDLIFAGNKYLAEYAQCFNKNVVIVPTTIDTEEYFPVAKSQSDTITIGWSGSFSTMKHFSIVLPALEKIKELFKDRIKFRVIGDAGYRYDPLNILGEAWNRSTEIKDLQTFDIGIMPLPSDDWAKGKCGLKGLQYMALEIPTIMSPVGINTDIIQDGQNGLLAQNISDWVEKLTLLIENEKLRESIGRAGRETVENRYSVHSQKKIYIEYFNSLLDSN